jgi:hypothetical protein
MMNYMFQMLHNKKNQMNDDYFDDLFSLNINEIRTNRAQYIEMAHRRTDDLILDLMKNYNDVDKVRRHFRYTKYITNDIEIMDGRYTRKIKSLIDKMDLESVFPCTPSPELRQILWYLIFIDKVESDVQTDNVDRLSSC